MTQERTAQEHERLLKAIDEPDTRVVVIGGGVAGLVAARDCARPGFQVTVLEASSVVGGCVATNEIAGLRIDAGAESFATRGGTVAELIGELGLGDEIVQPNPAGAWLQLADRPVPMPKAGLLGIPSSPLAADVVAAIGWTGALRAYLDRLMPVLKIGQERNLGRLVRRRMGTAVLERLVAPVTSGVYSADPDQLDVAIAAPGLSQALSRLGSLSGAVAELRTEQTNTSSSKAGSAVGGLAGGMSRLVEALSADLIARGGAIRTGASVVGLTPFSGHEAAQPDNLGEEAVGLKTGMPEPKWMVVLEDGEVIEADSVLLALPAEPALELLRGLGDAALDGLEWPQASSVELVTLVLDAPALDAAPRGTGMLVAEDVPSATVTAKALTHATAKWAWLAEKAGKSRHVLRLSYGRAGRPSPTAELSDGALHDLAMRDASTLLNIPLTASMIVGFARTRWTNALPFAAQGQKERIAAVRAHVDGLEGVEVTGTWLAGTGLASVIPDARAAATRLRGLRWRHLTQKLDETGSST